LLYLQSVEPQQIPEFDFKLFQKLIGDDAAVNLFTIVTKCDLKPKEDAGNEIPTEPYQHIKTFRSDRPLIECSKGQCRQVLKQVINDAKSIDALQIQKEIFLMGRKVRQTEAGQEFEKQRKQEYEELVRCYKDHIKELSDANKPQHEIDDYKRNGKKAVKEKKKELKYGRRVLNQSLDQGIVSSLLALLPIRDGIPVSLGY
jgi:hypothetical protein